MFTNHMNHHHAKHSGPVLCRECEGSPSYEDLDEWHGHAQTHLPESCGPFQRCQLCGKVYVNMHRNLTGAHKDQFEGPFPCPIRCGQTVDGQEAYEAPLQVRHAMSVGLM